MKLVEFGKPSLFKFCPSKYNIMEGCNSLRIGTLWGFREEENALLRDEGEGEFEFIIDFSEMTPVSQAWISEFDVGAKGSVYIEEMQINSGGIAVKGATLKGSTHNCWIFCVSLSGDAVGNVSQAHDSKWMIPEGKIQEFGNFLGTLLWGKVSIDDLPQPLVQKHTLQELHAGLALQVQMQAVSYIDRRRIIGSEADFPVEKIRELKNNIAFMKPKRFSAEQEFRFAFWLSFRNQRISINANPKIIQLRQIDQFVSKVPERS
ncbi:MAG: hypothetical protein JXQ79_07505 [Rhodobacteraceae bacterium]|nr:hypothetical protein [Paracoccaceae bacterium]